MKKVTKQVEQEGNNRLGYCGPGNCHPDCPVWNPEGDRGNLYNNLLSWES